MKQNKKLSLKEEMEKEAKRIEEEIVHNPELKDVEVSNEMESSLLVQIQTYEKKRAIESIKTDDTSDNTNEEFSEELTPNFNRCTNDYNIVRLSKDDLEALRAGRELLKKKGKDEELFEVSPEYHKHLNSDVNEKGKREINREINREKTRKFRMPRKKRFVIALAAVCILALAIGVTSMGSKSYLKILWEKMHGGQAMEVTNVEDMITQDSEDGKEVAAYREIREKLGFVPVRFGYKPEDIELENVKIDKEQRRAIMFYKFNGEIIRYTIYENDSDSSLGQKEEDILTDTIKVNVLNQTIKIEEYGKKKSKRYIANFTYKDVHYQLKGVMNKTEFVKIIKNLIYFNKKT